MRRVYHKLITNKSSNLRPSQLLLPKNIETFKQYRYTPYVSMYTANHPNMQKWIRALPTTSACENEKTSKINHRWWINRDCLYQIQQTVHKDNWLDIHLFGRTWLLPHVTPHAWSAFHLMHIYKEGGITAIEWSPSAYDFGESIMKYKGRINKNKREILSRRIGWNSLEI